MVFKEGHGSLKSVFGSDRNDWPQAMKNAQGLHHDGGFPYQLSIKNRPPKPIPAVDFSKKYTIKHWRSSEQGAKDLRYTDGILHHAVQADFQGHSD